MYRFKKLYKLKQDKIPKHMIVKLLNTKDNNKIDPDLGTWGS